MGHIVACKNLGDGSTLYSVRSRAIAILAPAHAEEVAAGLPKEHTSSAGGLRNGRSFAQADCRMADRVQWSGIAFPSDGFGLPGIDRRRDFE